MKARDLLDILSVSEKLKDATRHCYTSEGRHESVAEHSWQCTLIAFLLKDEFPDADMQKVINMCIIHDLGEAFTGDIFTFAKTEKDEMTEQALLNSWLSSIPEPISGEMKALFAEMEQRQTIESRIFKAIDSLEALVQHNLSPLDTWIPKEKELNKTYADDRVTFSEFLSELREEIRKDTLEKLDSEEE